MFAPAVDHDLSRELGEIDAVLCAHPEWEDWVQADLTKGVDASAGRDGMPAGLVLRVAITQRRLNLSLRAFSPLLADSLSMREFVGLGLGDRTPKRTTLQENLQKIQPETWGRIFRSLVTSAEVREHETGEKVRIDATVTASNVHTPSDSSLLWDCVRVLTRFMKRAFLALGVEFEDHSRVAKKLQSRIFYARRKAQRVPAYRELLDASQDVDDQAASVVSRLRKLEPREIEDCRARDSFVAEIDRYRGLFARVLDQTRRRIVGGESVPASEKVLSIFEPHTALLVKNGRDPEYGHKLTLTGGASGLVLDCVIEQGNPGDVTLAVRQLERQRALLGRAPHTAVFDGGYVSRVNFEGAKALGTERPVFTKTRGLLTPQEMAGSRRTYRRLRHFRAGVEGMISFLKRAFGLDRCTRKGGRGFASYVWSAVVAANLTTLARARLCAG
jgi:transposase, IS5 family